MFSKPQEQPCKNTTNLPLLIYINFLERESTSHCISILQYFLCCCQNNKNELTIASLFRIMCIQLLDQCFLRLLYTETSELGHVQIIIWYEVLHFSFTHSQVQLILPFLQLHNQAENILMSPRSNKVKSLPFPLTWVFCTANQKNKKSYLQLSFFIL